MRTAQRLIADIEQEYGGLVGGERFEATARTLDDLLRALTDEQG